MKKFTALLLILSLIEISCATMTTQKQKRFESSKERRGAILIITKKNGQQVGGELIAVKKDSLLLFIGVDVSVDISEIKVIRIVKKSKVLQGLGFGFLIGAGSGALMGLADGGDPSAWIGPRTAGEAAVWGAVVFGPLGAIIGGTLGFASGIDKTTLIEGKSPRWIEFYLKKLRKKARIRDYK